MIRLVLAIAAVATAATFAALRIPERAQDADGKAIYLKQCRTCHGVTGEPSALNRDKYPKIQSFVDPKFFAKVSDDSLVAVLKKGVGKDMKSFEGKLTAQEMLAVAKYARTLAVAK